MPGIQRESLVLVDDSGGGGGAPVNVSITDIVDTISVVNSTTTPMLAGQFFTGVFENILGFAGIVITANSDGQAVADGISLEFSTNGVDVDYFLIANHRDNTVGFEVTIPVLAQFFRIRWHTQQNQTWFRLETVYKRILAAFNPLTHIELPSPDNVVVIGANRGGSGPGLGVSALRLFAKATPDLGDATGVYALITRSQPGVLDRSQFLEQISGDYPIGAAFYDTIPDLVPQQSGVLRCTPQRELFVNPRGTELTPLVPAAVSVGIASGLIVASNPNRKSVRIVNTSAAARVSLAFGVAAVLDSGMTLYPGGTFSMDEFDFTRNAINGIASAAATNVGVQEFS